ncbi:MAG TPA: DUF58 domain-containing protein [Tepidisphaeraceae bacterium]|jgi:uncharacterized protein (DUF58 family)
MAESSPYLRPEILAQIVKLGLRAQRVVEGTISGLHRSPLHGVSVEFADYREYTPGDDLKRLDWRAYARSNRHFIKQYEEESNLRCTILMDASASMRYGRKEMTKFEYGATLAASLAFVCVKQRDAVGLALFDREERTWLRPAATQSQLTKIIDALEKAKPERETDTGAVMLRVCDQIKSRGVVIIISDLLCDLDAFYAALGRFQYSGHEVMIMQILDSDEIELPFQDSVLFKDIEGAEELFAEPWAFRKAYKQAMENFIDEVKQRCQFAGIDHILLRTDENLGLGLSHYLHQRQRGDHGKRGGKIGNFRG